MNLQVEKSDITLLGHTHWNEDGNLAIAFDSATFRIESILFRTVLKCFGEEYQVVKEEDYIDELANGTSTITIHIFTNLPYSEFEKEINNKSTVRG